MSVDIDELVLRIPGVDADTARRIVEEVADRVARGLRAPGPLSLPDGASLRITLPPANTPELAATIAARILEALS